MYAYVKLLSSGKCTTVGINQIKGYKPNRPNKTFQVKIKGDYHLCLVGLTNESKDGLTEQINKGGRIRFPSAALLSDLSEQSEVEEKARSKGKKAPVEDNTRDILNKKLAAINKKKKHHNHDNKEDTLARINQVEQGIKDLMKELELQKQMLQKILDFWNEHRDTPSNHGSVELEKKTGCPQVGFTRVSDNSVKPVENTDTEDIDSSDIEENTVASDGEEDSGQSTDEDKGERNDNSESDNTMSHQKKDEETDCDHEVETTEAVSNAAEEKLNQERSEHKDESELNNMSTQGEEKEKVTD